MICSNKHVISASNLIYQKIFKGGIFDLINIVML